MREGRIYIPSYRRAHRILKNTQTIAFMSPDWKKRTIVVVRQEERHEYAKVLEGTDVGLLTIPESCIRLTEQQTGREFIWMDTMDWIVDFACSLKDGGDFCIMDDDLTMSYRENLLAGSPKPMTEDQWNLMLMELMHGVSPTIPITSTIFRGYCSQKTSEYQDNCAVNGIFGMSKEFFKEHPEFRFSATKAIHMPDRALVLMLLTHGYKTRAYCRFCYNDVADTSGGCSTNRDAEGHSKSAAALAAEYPRYVSLTVKTNLGDTRIGTTVQWNKAYKEAIRAK